MKKILMLVDELYEDLELNYPKIRLEEEKSISVVSYLIVLKSLHNVRRY